MAAASFCRAGVRAGTACQNRPGMNVIPYTHCAGAARNLGARDLDRCSCVLRCCHWV
jgi:hypothetical protein